MPDKVEITRKQVIIVDEVGENSYGDLTWTAKGGKEYKVKSTRKQYFGVIKPGCAVEISYSEYKGTEYPYSAEAVDTRIPEPSADAQFDALKSEQKAKGDVPKPVATDMSKSDWAEKDRITRKSIERQTALKEANLRVGISESEDEVVRVAKVFEKYIEGASST